MMRPHPLSKSCPCEICKRWNPTTNEEKRWVSAKIAKLIREGYPQDQAVAIAHSMGEKHFEGGHMGEHANGNS